MAPHKKMFLCAILILISILLPSTLASPLLATATNPTDLGTGSGIVTFTNACPFPLWYQLVPSANGNTAHDNPDWQILTTYSNALISFGDGQGQSFKVALNNLDNQATTDIDQVEFTWLGTASQIYYDLSHVNGNALSGHKVSVVPSTGPSTEFPTCELLDCPDDSTSCLDAFQKPLPDRTMTCADATNIVTTFCG